MRPLGNPILVAAYKHVLQLLQKVKHYPYHNIGHTLDVFRRARELAKSEHISPEEEEDVLLAALFHDTGFIESYSKIGVRIARDWLTLQWHPKTRIARVESLILATIPFSKTKSVLEQIIQDADLDNFGRDDCFQKMQKVEEELRIMTPLDTRSIYTIFRKLHHEFRFQTKTSIRERQAKKFRNAIRFDRIYEHVLSQESSEVSLPIIV
jgi:uncharacterized protein